MRNNIFNRFIILMRITYFLSKKLRKKKNTPIKLVSVLALIKFLSILFVKKKKSWFLSCEHQQESVLSYFKNYTIRTESMPEYVCKLDVVGNLLPIKDRNDGEEKLRLFISLRLFLQHIVNIQTKSIAKYVWKDFVDNFWTIKGRNAAKKTRKKERRKTSASSLWTRIHEGRTGAWLEVVAWFGNMLSFIEKTGHVHMA